VISRNDPYVTYDQAKLFAQAWGSNLVDLGLAGHINTQAGFGPWPEGRTHLRALIDQLDPIDEGAAFARACSCN
jgi:predicted alpha/beta hydrolase family esterase